MARKARGGRGAGSVDAYLKAYRREAPAAREKDDLEGALAREKSRRAEEARKASDARGSGDYALRELREKDDEVRDWRIGRGAGGADAVHDGGQEEIRSPAIVLFLYAFTAFAIGATFAVMLFLLPGGVYESLSGDVPLPVREGGWRLSEFFLSNALYFAAFMLLIFVVQAAYYAGHWAVERKRKGYARRDYAYSIGFSLAMLLASAAIAFGLGLF